MKKLQIAKDLTLPIEVAGQAVALVGIRGSGKTNTAGVIAEELLERGQQIVVIDPTDAWWGLRSKYPVFIFGGPHGDLPLNEGDGKTLAEFVVQERVPIILSLRHLRKGAQRRLMTEFCEELYHLKGQPNYQTPLTVFIDEAPQFIPQRVTGEMARLVGAVQDMILLGRSVGFGVVMISQRFATLNADVRTQADTIIVHRLPSPLDRKALTEWIEENATIAEQKVVLSSLATLKTGEAWVWAPYFDLFTRAQIRPRHTFDSSAAPKRDGAAATTGPKDLKQIDLEKLKGKLSAAIEKAKADDPRELHKKVADLTKQLEAAHKRTPIVNKSELKTIEKHVLKDGQLARVEALVDRLEKHAMNLMARGVAIASEFEAFSLQVRDQAAAIASAIKLTQLSPPASGPDRPATRPSSPPAPVSRAAAPVGHRASSAARTNGLPTDGVKLKKGARDILNALAASHPKSMKWSQLALLCGIKSKGSTMSSYMSNLRMQGFLTESGDDIGVTTAGLDYFGDAGPAPLQSKTEMIALWSRRLKKGARAILDDLDRRYPAYRTKEELSEEVLGIAAGGSTLSSYLSNLRIAGLIEEDDSGRVRLHSDLEGR